VRDIGTVALDTAPLVEGEDSPAPLAQPQLVVPAGYSVVEEIGWPSVVLLAGSSDPVRDGTTSSALPVVHHLTSYSSILRDQAYCTIDNVTPFPFLLAHLAP
jgi:hypothetical protein